MKFRHPPESWCKRWPPQRNCRGFHWTAWIRLHPCWEAHALRAQAAQTHVRSIRVHPVESVVLSGYLILKGGRRAALASFLPPFIAKGENLQFSAARGPIMNTPISVPLRSNTCRERIPQREERSENWRR